MSDHIAQTILEAMERLRQQESEVRKTKVLVNQLRSFNGEPPAFPDAEDVSGGATPLRGDEYHGRSQHVACREILERRKLMNCAPVSYQQIYDDLLAGGYAFETDNIPNRQRGLTQTLSKGSAVFYKLPNGRWGLCEWYPNAKQARGQRKKKPDVDGAQNGPLEPEDPIAQVEG